MVLRIAYIPSLWLIMGTAVLFAVLLKEGVMCIVLPECEEFNGLGIQR